MTTAEPTPFKSRGALDLLSIALSSAFFTSYLPATLMARSRHERAESLTRRKLTGAGLIGSLWGVFTYVCLPFGWGSAWPALAIGLAVSIIASDRAEKALGVHDDPRIVIDEWVGCWIAVWGLAPEWGLPMAAGLVLFRIFDVLKGPWGRYLQKLPGGFGVVLDDVAAGIVANLVLRVLLHFFPAL